MEGFRPFKGAETVENAQKVVEFVFEDFKNYEQFGRKINQLNEELLTASRVDTNRSLGDSSARESSVGDAAWQ